MAKLQAENVNLRKRTKVCDKEEVVEAAEKQVGTFTVKAGMAQMLKGGVIMDVINPEQARIAEEAGACAVMALERVPADIRKDGGVARMSDPRMIKEIKQTVTIPVMAKSRIGHFVECQVLQEIGIDYIDESEVLTMADEENHINKNNFTVPFVCGCRNLGEALRRVAEGASMLRTKGEAGTGNAGVVIWARLSDVLRRVLRCCGRRARPGPGTSSRPCATLGPSRSRSRCSRRWMKMNYLWPRRRCRRRMSW